MNKVTIFYTRVLIILAILSFPFIFLQILFRKREIRQKKSLRILVIPQLTRIGDVLCATPVFAAIKEKYPDCHLSVLSSLNAVGIIEENPRINELIIIEDYRANFLALLKKIRDEKFDIGISLSGTSLSSLLFFFGFIPDRIKITRSTRPLAEVLTDWLCNKKKKYEALTYLPLFYCKLLENLDIYSTNVKKEVYYTESSVSVIDSWLLNNNITDVDRIAGVSITAGNKIKEWGDVKFERLAREIVRRYKFKVVFIGSNRDGERIGKLIEELGSSDDYINAAGITLGDLPVLMSKFTVFVSADTGPVHIAEALKIPLVDILGPVNDIEMTPRGDTVRIVKPAPGIPPTIFAFRESGDMDITMKALDSIGVYEVIAAIDSLDL